MVSYCAMHIKLECCYFENVGPNLSKLGSFVDNQYIIYIITLDLFNFWIKWGKGYVTAIFQFLLMLLVSSIKDQSK